MVMSVRVGMSCLFHHGRTRDPFCDHRASAAWRPPRHRIAPLTEESRAVHQRLPSRPVPRFKTAHKRHVQSLDYRVETDIVAHRGRIGQCSKLPSDLCMASSIDNHHPPHLYFDAGLMQN